MKFSYLGASWSPPTLGLLAARDQRVLFLQRRDEFYFRTARATPMPPHHPPPSLTALAPRLTLVNPKPRRAIAAAGASIMLGRCRTSRTCRTQREPAASNETGSLASVRAAIGTSFPSYAAIILSYTSCSLYGRFSLEYGLTRVHSLASIEQLSTFERRDVKIRSRGSDTENRYFSDLSLSRTVYNGVRMIRSAQAPLSQHMYVVSHVIAKARHFERMISSSTVLTLCCV